MKKCFYFLGWLFLSACSTSVSYSPNIWSQYAYEGFSEKVNALAGVDAINCGFYDLTQRPLKVSISMERAIRDCVQKNLDAGKAFKFGFVRIPVDSYLYEVVLQDDSHQKWLVTYDLMLDQSDAILWAEKCQSIRINMESLAFEGDDCTDASSKF